MNVKEKSQSVTLKMYEKKKNLICHVGLYILHVVKVYWFCTISETTLTHKTDNPFYTCKSPDNIRQINIFYRILTRFSLNVE